jgi:RimJ/RimL family protein N-acetyltransferase
MTNIETERLILRPQAIADFDVWFPMYADPQIFQITNSPGFTPEEG